jgi:hypothetical protein
MRASGVNSHSRRVPPWFSTWPFSPPAAGGQAIDQVVVHQRQEAPIELALLAHPDRIDPRFGIVVDAGHGHSTPKGEGPVVRIEDPLLSFARIGHDCRL